MEQAFKGLAASTNWWVHRQPHLTLKYTYSPIFTSCQPPLQITHKIRDRGGVNTLHQRSIHTTNFGRPNCLQIAWLFSEARPRAEQD